MARLAVALWAISSKRDPRGPGVDVGSGDESPREDEFNLRSSAISVKRSGALCPPPLAPAPAPNLSATAAHRGYAIAPGLRRRVQGCRPVRTAVVRTSFQSTPGRRIRLRRVRFGIARRLARSGCDHFVEQLPRPAPRTFG